MKYFWSFCIVLLTASGLTAQSGRAEADSVTVLIKDAYNREDAGSIYQLTAESFRGQIPDSVFITINARIYSQLGRWNNYEFMKAGEGGYFYKAYFANDSAQYFISLDDAGKVQGFTFTPLKREAKAKSKDADSDNKLVTALDKKVEELVRPYIQKENTRSICIAVIDGDKVYNYSYGETAAGNNKLPDAENTIYEIGSVTKTFTSTVLAGNVLKGEMSLGDEVNRYLPDSIPRQAYRNIPVTLLTLANHTSGYPTIPDNLIHDGTDMNDPYKDYDVDKLYSYLMNYKLTREPGTKFEYSNLGMGLLGTILAQHERKTYEELVQERICVPLGMKDTKITLTDSDKGRLAQGYNEKGEPVSAWYLNTLEGAGALKSTINDMVKYVKANMGLTESAIKEAAELSHQKTFQIEETGAGLGWRIDKRDGKTLYNHSGATGGYRSFTGFDKENGKGVVILSNSVEEVTDIGITVLSSEF